MSLMKCEANQTPGFYLTTLNPHPENGKSWSCVTLRLLRLHNVPSLLPNLSWTNMAFSSIRAYVFMILVRAKDCEEVASLTMNHMFSQYLLACFCAYRTRLFRLVLGLYLNLPYRYNTCRAPDGEHQTHVHVKADRLTYPTTLL